MGRVCAVLRAGPASALALSRLAMKGAVPQMGSNVCHKTKTPLLGGAPSRQAS